MTKPIVQDLHNVAVSEGETAKLACLVAGDALPHIRFMKEINGTEHELVDLDQYKNRIRTRTISPPSKTEFFKRYVWIANVTSSDQGRYTCKAGNSIGVTRKDVYLTVVTEPVTEETRLTVGVTTWKNGWFSDLFYCIITQ